MEVEIRGGDTERGNAQASLRNAGMIYGVLDRAVKRWDREGLARHGDNPAPLWPKTERRSVGQSD